MGRPFMHRIIRKHDPPTPPHGTKERSKRLEKRNLRPDFNVDTASQAMHQENAGLENAINNVGTDRGTSTEDSCKKS